MRNILFITIVASACTSSELQRQSRRVDHAKSETTADTNSSKNLQTVTEEKVSAPTNVAGSYLHCLVQDVDHSSDSEVICRVNSANQQRLDTQGLGLRATYDYIPSSVEGVAIAMTDLDRSNGFDVAYLFSGDARDVIISALKQTTLRVSLSEVSTSEVLATYSELGARFFIEVPAATVTEKEEPANIVEVPVVPPPVVPTTPTPPPVVVPEAPPVTFAFWKRDFNTDTNANRLCDDTQCSFIDERTGLIWARVEVELAWMEANDYCEGLTFGGSSEWFLAYDREVTEAINNGLFTVTPLAGDKFARYWSEDAENRTSGFVYTKNSSVLSPLAKTERAGVFCHRHP